MLACLHHIWHWILDWFPYFLPAASNLFLVLLGVLLSLPTLAEAIEKTPKYRIALGATCLIAGLVGFCFDVGQRRNSDTEFKHMVTSVDTLVASTNGLVGNTNQMVTAFGIILPQITVLNSRTADLDLKIVAARGNPRLVATLQAQAKEAQTQADAASKQLLVTTAQGISQQLSYMGQRWWMESGDITTVAAMERANNGSHPTQAEVQDRRSRLDRRYIDLATPLLVTTDYLRRQLLQRLQSGETQEDKAGAVIFAKAVAGQDFDSGELYGAGQYLLSLSRRVSPSNN